MCLFSSWSFPAEPRARVAALLGPGPPSAWPWLGCGMVAFGHCCPAAPATLLLLPSGYRATMPLPLPRVVAQLLPVSSPRHRIRTPCGSALLSALARCLPLLRAHGRARCRLAIYGAAVAHARTFPQTAWGCSTCTSTALMAPSASRQEENGQSSYLQPLLCHPDQMTPIAQFGMVKSPRLASSRLALHHEVTEPPVPTLP
jgi:hypothetical protein